MNKILRHKDEMPTDGLSALARTANFTQHALLLVGEGKQQDPTYQISLVSGFTDPPQRRRTILATTMME